MLHAWRLLTFCHAKIRLTWRVSQCLGIRNLLCSLDGKEELFKLKFSGLTVEKVSIPIIIEAFSSLKQSIF